MRAVAYLRVSSTSQVEGYSLDAQQRMFHDACKNRGWEPGQVYREEGKSAHTDSISKRPVLRQLLKDASRGEFDLVVVHTLDRWARKMSIQIEALTSLSRNRIGFVSVSDHFDATTPQGRLMLNQLGSFNEFYSDLLGIHVSKAFRYQAESGLTVGPVPFGYRRQGKGLPPVVEARESEALQEAFHRGAEG